MSSRALCPGGQHAESTLWRAICRNMRRTGVAYLMVMIEYGAGARPPRDLMRAMLRGFAQRCPDCGKGNDAPPYFTILIVGHFIVGGVLALEKGLAPPTWVHLSIWLPLTLIASLWL